MQFTYIRPSLIILFPSLLSVPCGGKFTQRGRPPLLLSQGMAAVEHSTNDEQGESATKETEIVAEQELVDREEGNPQQVIISFFCPNITINSTSSLCK